MAMKALITGGVCALLAAATPGLAQELQWRAPSPSTISLSRPVPVVSGAVEPASYTSPAAIPAVTLDRPTPIFRAKAPELEDVHQLLPLGPAPDNVPGTVKPMSQAEQIKPMPKKGFTAPEPQIILEPGGHEAHMPFLDSCAPSNDCCVPECCTPCGPWWHRLGNRLQCWDNCSDPCGMDACCPPRSRKWFRAEYLLWQITDQDLPPLLSGERVPLRAVDGGAGTLPLSPILFGDDESNDEAQSGFRTHFGFWFPWRGVWGMDFSGFMLVRRTNELSASSDALGNPVLARPFFDVTLPGENAQIVSYPGEFAGRFSADWMTRVWGVDAHFRRKLWCGPRGWVDGFLGYRHLQVNDTLNINEEIVDINLDPGDASGFRVRDSFNTRNHFNGFQFGLEWERRFLRRWFVAGNFKLALGNVHQVVQIDGSTDFLFPGGASVRGTGGLFALVSNIGRYERDEFAIVPEFGIKVGLDLTDHLRMYAGYNLLCLSSAVRAGEQIDRAVNPAMLPDIVTPPGLIPPLTAPTRPTLIIRDSTFWAGGAQFGIEYHW
jgi:hypothetical protein